MILEDLGSLNWLAIVVAAVAWFLFSAVWYSVPSLSRAWQRASKVDMGDDPPSLVALLIPTFVGYLVTSFVIAVIARAIGITTFADGIILGVVLGLGFGMVGALVNQLYELKGSSYWLINGINAVIAYSIVAVIVTVWD